MSKHIFQGLADNQPLFDEVKKLLIDQFSLDKLETNLTNVELGEKVRARMQALQGIEDAFRVIAQHRSEKETVEKKNPAR